jgi:hypothetical protein
MRRTIRFRWLLFLVAFVGVVAGAGVAGARTFSLVEQGKYICDGVNHCAANGSYNCTVQCNENGCRCTIY